MVLRPPPRTDDYREIEGYFREVTREINELWTDVGTKVTSPVTLDDFLSGLRPISIVTSLPSLPDSDYPNNSVVILTTDSKLYRNDGGTWNKATDGADIVANSVTGGKIVAGAIVASHISVYGQGGSININPNCDDSSAWSFTGGTSVQTVTDGKIGNKVLRSAAGVYGTATDAKKYPVDPTKVYRVRLWVRRSSAADGVFYAGLSLQDSSGTNITGDGTYWYYWALSVTPPADTWTEYVGEFGPGTTKGVIPSNARTMGLVGLFNYNSPSGGYYEIQDIRIEEKVPTGLIVDGAIRTDQIYSGSYTPPGDDNVTPGAGMKLDVDSGKIEAYGNAHSLGGDLVSSDGNWMVSVGKSLTATGLFKRYPLHNATNFASTGQIHIYRWSGSAWIESSVLGGGAGSSGISGDFKTTTQGIALKATNEYAGGYGIFAWGEDEGTGYGGVFEHGNHYIPETYYDGKGPVVLTPSVSAAAPTHSALKGTVWVTSDGVMYVNTDGSTAWEHVGGTNIVLASDKATTTDTLADVAGMSFAVEANSIYTIEGFLVYDTTAVAMGVKLSATGPTSPDIHSGLVLVHYAIGSPADVSSWNADDVVEAMASFSATTGNLVFFRALLKTGANSGTWQLRHAMETSGAYTVTLKAGSTITYRKVG
jgi:hypothetical protein